MKNHGIAINDPFSTLAPHMERLMKPDDVHPDAEGYELLGKQVAAAIEKTRLFRPRVCYREAIGGRPNTSTLGMRLVRLRE